MYKFIIGFFVYLAMSFPTFADTKLASWNMMRLADNKDNAVVVDILKNFDLVAIQEIMDPDALVRIVTELQTATSEEWGILISHPIGRGTYKETYGYIWRKSVVNYTEESIIYIDDRDIFAREPIAAKFQTNDGNDFVLANIHVLYGKSKADRIPEIKALVSYWEWLAEVFPNEQFFLAGDFNMSPDHNSFDDLKVYADAVIYDEKTSLSTKEGMRANLYDNIWYPRNIDAKMGAGVYDFTAIYGLTNKYARSNVSDHLPVYLIIQSFDENSGQFVSRVGDVVEKKVEAAYTVVGNSNSKIYHVYGCKSYEKMLSSVNRIDFDTEADAIEAGYRKAKKCR